MGLNNMTKAQKSEFFNTAEALLFVSGEPVSIPRFSEILEMPEQTVEKLMTEMINEYNYQRRGMKLIRLENSYQLVTRSEYFDYVVKMVTSGQRKVLSSSVLEVLSIIAYNQPVTKAAIEHVRGVDSSYSISKLLERNLIEQRGRLELPGRPLLYGTTDEFLRCFGLESLKELPALDENATSVINMLEDDNITFEEMESEGD